MEIRNKTILTYQQISNCLMTTSRVKRTLLIWGVLLILQGIIIGYEYIENGETNEAILVMFLILLVAFIWYPIKIRSIYKNASGNSSYSWSYVFKDDELEETMSNGKVKEAHATYKYEAFEKIEITKKYIVLYLSKAEYLPIDKRSFLSEKEMNEVLLVLQSKIKKK